MTLKNEPTPVAPVHCQKCGRERAFPSYDGLCFDCRSPVAVQPVEEGERERALVYAVRHIRMVEKRWRLDHPDSKVHKRCADQLDMALRQIEVDNSLSRALASPTSSVAVQTEQERERAILEAHDLWSPRGTAQYPAFRAGYLAALRTPPVQEGERERELLSRIVEAHEREVRRTRYADQPCDCPYCEEFRARGLSRHDPMAALHTDPSEER